MIKTTAFYMVSKDGGREWGRYNNMLLTGFYNNDLSSIIKGHVGARSEAVQYSDSAIPSLAMSEGKTELDPFIRVSALNDRFIITKGVDLDFGVGHSFSMNEIGVSVGQVLVSRALFLDDAGNQTSIQITEKDDLKVRYTIEYEIPRSPTRVQLTHLGRIIGASVFFVNPNMWGGEHIGQTNQFDFVVVGRGFSVNKDGYLTTGVSVGSLPINTTTTSNDDKKSHTAGFIASPLELNGSFDQILFCRSADSHVGAQILIQLDEEITKSSDDSFSLSASIIQEH